MKYKNKDATTFLLDILFLFVMTLSPCSSAESLPQEQEGIKQKPNPFLEIGTQILPWGIKTPHGRHSVVDSLVDELLPFNTDDIDRQSAPTYPIEVVQWTEKKEYPIQDSHANTARRKKMKEAKNTEVKGRDPGRLAETSIGLPQLLVRLQTIADRWGELAPALGRDEDLSNASSNPVNGYRSVNTIRHQENRQYHFSLGDKDNKPNKAQTAEGLETGYKKNKADTKGNNFDKTGPCVGRGCNDKKQERGEHGNIQFLSVLGSRNGLEKNQKDEESAITVWPSKYPLSRNGAKEQEGQHYNYQKWEPKHVHGETNKKAELGDTVSRTPKELKKNKNEKEETETKGEEEKSKLVQTVLKNTDMLKLKGLPALLEMDKLEGQGLQDQISFKNKVEDKEKTNRRVPKERTVERYTQLPQNDAIKNKIVKEQGQENRTQHGKSLVPVSQDKKKLEDHYMDDNIDNQKRHDFLSKLNDEKSSVKPKETPKGAQSYREPDTTRGYNETPPVSRNDDGWVSEKLAHGSKSQEAIIVENSQRGPGLVVEIQTQSSKSRARRNTEGQEQKPTEGRNEDGQGQSENSTHSLVSRQESTTKPNAGHTKLEALKSKSKENEQSPGNQEKKDTVAGNSKNANRHREVWENTDGERRQEQQKQAQTLEGDGPVNELKSDRKGNINAKTEGSKKYDVADRAHPKRKDDASPRVFLAFFIFFIVLFFIVTLVIRSVYNPNSGLSRANSRTALYQPNAMY